MRLALHSLGVSRMMKPLWIALAISLLIHLALLSQRWFNTPEVERRLNTPLSVVLVNASSPSPPQKAQKLAQANLDGGGLTIREDASALHRAHLGADARLEHSRSARSNCYRS